MGDGAGVAREGVEPFPMSCREQGARRCGKFLGRCGEFREVK